MNTINELYVYNETVQPLGIVDEIVSLMWIRRYGKSGAFELYVPASVSNTALLLPHRYLYRPDVDEAMYISSIQEKYTDEKNIIVSGYSLDGLFRKRKLPANVDENSILNTLQLCSTFGCSINYFDPDNLVSSFTEKGSFDKDTNAEEYMRYIMNQNECFLKVELNVSDRCLDCTVCKSVDKSDSVIFSEDYDNLFNSVYEFSEDGCATTIYGECNQPSSNVRIPNGLPTYTINTDVTGLSCTEKVVLIDAVTTLQLVSEEDEVSKANTGKTTTITIDLCSAPNGSTVTTLAPNTPVIIDGTEGDWYKVTVPTLSVTGYCRKDYIILDPTYSFVEYDAVDYDKTLEALKKACNEALSEFTESYVGDISEMNGYRTAFDVGDTVTIQNGVRQIRFTKRVEEVQETFDSDGYSITPTFGEPLKTIYDYIKI